MAGQIILGNLVVDLDRFTVWVGERPVDLTFIEFELLLCLARNAGKVMSRESLLRAVWGACSEGDYSKVRVHLSRLRKKICESNPWALRSVTRRGYALIDPGRRPLAEPPGDVLIGLVSEAMGEGG